MTLGEYLKIRRVARGWTKVELAKRAGISKVYLIHLENDRRDPSLSVLSALAKAFDLGVGDMLTEAGYTVRVNPDDATDGLFWCACCCSAWESRRR